MRATRDLLRRRLHLVRKRGQLLAHIQNTQAQYNLPGFGRRLAYPANREGVAEHFPEPSVRKSIEVDLALLDRYDALITDSSSRLSARPNATTPTRSTVCDRCPALERSWRARSSMKSTT